MLDKLIGRVGDLAMPSDRQTLADTAIADAQSRPYNSESQPAGSPIPAVTGQPSTEIKHVFYIVRENRTYDQVFGSDPRGDGTQISSCSPTTASAARPAGSRPTPTRSSSVSSRCSTTSTWTRRSRSTGT